MTGGAFTHAMYVSGSSVGAYLDGTTKTGTTICLSIESPGNKKGVWIVPYLIIANDNCTLWNY